MNIRIECYPEEFPAAEQAIRSCFRVASVSKPYYNTRQTGTQGAPCECRYYIKLDPKEPMAAQDGGIDMMALDMLRFLASVQEACGADTSCEVPRVRAFYEAAGRMPQEQRFALLSEWRAGVVLRYFGRKGGPCNGSGNR